MKISKLIRKLEALKKEHGDVQCYLSWGWQVPTLYFMSSIVVDRTNEPKDIIVIE